MNDQQTMQLILCALLLLCGYLFLLRRTARRVAAREALPAAGAVLLVLYLVIAAAFCLIVGISVGQAMLLPALLLLMLFAVPAAAARRLSSRWRELRPLPAALLLLWLIAAAYLTLAGREGGSRSEVLLHFDAATEAFQQRSFMPLAHFALNSALFVPLGLLLPLTLPGRIRCLDTAASGLFLTTCIESAQLLWQLGLCDVEDLAANLLGALLGYLLYRMFFPVRPPERRT